MTGCYDEGRLRAYLDDELPGQEAATITRHLAQCARCQQQRARLQEHAAQVSVLLKEPALPDVHAAFYRFQSGIRTGQAAGQLELPVTRRLSRITLWRTRMDTTLRSWFQTHRKLAATLAAVCLMLTLLIFPPVRAVADQFLQIFRVRQVLFVPISTERMEQLENLDVDANTLFISKPEVVGNSTEPYSVTTIADAESAVGYTLHQPTFFTSAPTATEITVNDSTTFAFQINVEGARQMLQVLEIDDVTLPDALGTTPITASMPASAALSYSGEDYQLLLYQGQSPEMQLPEGLDLSQLGKAGLRMLGLTPDEAERLSQQVDWSSTLLFPFPANIDDISQITINGASGLLTRSRGEGRRAQHWQLYWQQDDRFYVLWGTGNISRDEIVQTADSVR